MQGIGRIISTILYLGIYECIISTVSVYALSALFEVEGFWVSFLVRETLAVVLAFVFILIINKIKKNQLSAHNLEFLIFDKFDINEKESFEGSVYQISELNEFTMSVENSLCTADNTIKELAKYINNIGNSVFNRPFPSNQTPELRIRIYKTNGMWTLHFRDNGERFDPTEQNVFDGFNAKYIRSMNQNVLTLQQNNQTT